MSVQAVSPVSQAIISDDHFLKIRDAQGNCEKIIRVYQAVDKSDTPQFYTDRRAFETLEGAQKRYEERKEVVAQAGRTQEWVFIASYVVLLVAAVFVRINPSVALALIIAAPVLWGLSMIYDYVKSQGHPMDSLQDRVLLAMRYRQADKMHQIFLEASRYWMTQYEKATPAQKQKIAADAATIVARNSQAHHLSLFHCTAEMIVALAKNEN